MTAMAQERRTAGGIEPIRTPAAYLEALSLGLDMLGDAAEAAQRSDPHAKEIAERAEEVARNLRESPFQMRRGEVIAKGFLPRIVR